MSHRGRSAARIAVQLVGVLLGLLALGWCVRQALDPRNTEQFSRLTDASAASVAAMLGLTVASLLLNGLIFWATIRPVHRLRVTDVLAVNALATFLAYLPFKLGAVARAAIHNRRDGVPLPVIGAWFAAVMALILATLGPLAAVSLWRGSVDAAWIAAGLGGITVIGIAMVAVARALRGPTGIARLERAASVAHTGLARRILRSRAWGHLHRGFDIIASPETVAGASLLRLADAGAQAARFLVAASILVQPLAPEQAVLIATAFFLIGVVSPTGMLGFREAGAAGLAGALAFARTDEFAAVALLVGAADAIVNMTGAGAGLGWLWYTRSAAARPTAPVNPAA